MVPLNDPSETFKENKSSSGEIWECVIPQRETIHSFVSQNAFPAARRHDERTVNFLRHREERLPHIRKVIK